MWVEIQHQMEVLNPIYMTPNMTALDENESFTRMKILNEKYWEWEWKTFIWHSVMKRDGVDKMLINQVVLMRFGGQE